MKLPQSLIKIRDCLKNYIRWCLMPGFDLFTRRRVRLSRHWLQGKRRVLDAGVGNGWFSYLAYLSGATVIAVNIAQDQVDRAIKFYNVWRKIPTNRLKFLKMNLYELDSLEPGFDEIICYETLEHIKDDVKVCQVFWRLLKPGGYLYLSCPYAEHPKWKSEVLDTEERGNHVRKGYTLESYRALLEPIGFKILETEGMGGPLLTNISIFFQRLRNSFGDFWVFPYILLVIPFVWFDPIDINLPYCLYIKAIKPRFR